MSATASRNRLFRRTDPLQRKQRPTKVFAVLTANDLEDVGYAEFVNGGRFCRIRSDLHGACALKFRGTNDALASQA
jgi:hypothetical protein